MIFCSNCLYNLSGQVRTEEGARGWEGIYKFKSCLFLINSDMTTDKGHMQGAQEVNQAQHIPRQTQILSKINKSSWWLV